MEKKNLVFSKEGMKVGVREVTEEAEKDLSQSVLVNMWNHTSFPAYKSRLWNMAGSSEDQDSVGKRKP
ncbi:hypothetical protein PHISP_05229 [Aspergillus sp. HF37]|nr:hypothetical protein PHISP_05229 [Aspergillus sp. HF37]